MARLYASPDPSIRLQELVFGWISGAPAYALRARGGGRRGRGQEGGGRDIEVGKEKGRKGGEQGRRKEQSEIRKKRGG